MINSVLVEMAFFFQRLTIFISKSPFESARSEHLVPVLLKSRVSTVGANAFHYSEGAYLYKIKDSSQVGPCSKV
jgi:hypothetical protein